MSKPRKLPSGKWQAYIHIQEDGRRRQVALGTFFTASEAKRAIAKAEADYAAQTLVKPSDGKVLLRDYAESWYDARLTPSKKVRSILDARVLPYWGERRLADIDRAEVKAWVKELAGELSPSSVHEYYHVLRRVFASAQEDGLIARTPCRLREDELPKRAGTVAPGIFLTRDEISMVLAVMPARYAALVYTAVWTGMRSGELLALRWDNVDLERAEINVCEAVKRDTGKIGPPKNGKARVVHVDETVVDVLRAHRRDFGGSPFVFTGPRGGRIHYNTFRTRVWDRYVPLTGIRPQPTFHDLRHSHCSLMIAQGMDWVTLSDRLGHHAPAFTMNVYGHLRHDHADHVREVLRRARNAQDEAR